MPPWRPNTLANRRAVELDEPLGIRALQKGLNRSEAWVVRNLQGRQIVLVLRPRPRFSGKAGIRPPVAQ
jgi:hypothetical protein